MRGSALLAEREGGGNKFYYWKYSNVHLRFLGQILSFSPSLLANKASPLTPESLPQQPTLHFFKLRHIGASLPDQFPQKNNCVLLFTHLCMSESQEAVNIFLITPKMSLAYWPFNPECFSMSWKLQQYSVRQGRGRKRTCLTPSSSSSYWKFRIFSGFSDFGIFSPSFLGKNFPEYPWQKCLWYFD